MDGLHPSLKFTWSISDEQLPFHDLILKPTTDRLVKACITISIQLTSILTLIMHSRTPLVVRKLSPIVSFSAYGASTVTRLILKKRA